MWPPLVQLLPILGFQDVTPQKETPKQNNPPTMKLGDASALTTIQRDFSLYFA
ncbi:MAG TPA: hypothetical protein VOA41_17840 [Candidatus Dormibacteraeota bacterium]|nr:hypothetical protein [Candidatus Dormibacteraeota bacterium]